MSKWKELPPETRIQKFCDRMGIDNWYIGEDFYGEHGVRSDKEKLERYIEKFIDNAKERWNFYWEDSSMICDTCGMIFPTEYGSGNNYYIDYEYGFVCCEDCTKKNPDNYIQWLLGGTDRANTMLKAEEFEKRGYVLYNDGEEFLSGYYDGMNDAPEKIYKKIVSQKYPNMIFDIVESNPFMVRYRVWVYEGDEDYEK